MSARSAGAACLGGARRSFPQSSPCKAGLAARHPSRHRSDVSTHRSTRATGSCRIRREEQRWGREGLGSEAPADCAPKSGPSHVAAAARACLQPVAGGNTSPTSLLVHDCSCRLKTGSRARRTYVRLDRVGVRTAWREVAGHRLEAERAGRRLSQVSTHAPRCAFQAITPCSKRQASGAFGSPVAKGSAIGYPSGPVNAPRRYHSS